MARLGFVAVIHPSTAVSSLQAVTTCSRVSASANSARVVQIRAPNRALLPTRSFSFAYNAELQASARSAYFGNRSVNYPFPREVSSLRRCVHSVSCEAVKAGSAVAEPETVSNALRDPSTWDVKVLYDGDCPICLKEIDFLRNRDERLNNRILFEDISSPLFDPAENGGVDFATAMGSIHGQLPDGTVIHGMDVFRRLYAAVGLGWLYAPTAWPVLRPMFDRLYDFFARNRLTLTGRKMCDVECDLRDLDSSPSARSSSSSQS